VSIAIARQRNPGIHYEVFDGTRLPFADRSIDAAFAINVFHHVPVTQRSALVDDIHRVLRPGGLFAIFEHNPLNPVTRHVVDTCEFDKDAVLLKQKDSEALLSTSGFGDVKTRYIFAVPAPWGPNIIRLVPADRVSAWSVASTDLKGFSY
jgi:SAM-dependent methyltransferase